MKSHQALLSCGAAACVLAFSAQASAQAADAAPAGKGVGVQLEEVVVTAQRRAETSQRTALAITALSANQLQEQGVRTVTDLTTVVPGIQVGSTGGSVEISVRGIGSTNNTEVGDPAVAFNVDGVYMARPRSAAGLFFDLDRTEILRGPQGTLYGRNATAGSFNLITKKPTDTFEASGQLELGNFSLVRASGVLNAPLSDKVAIRGAFQTEKRDGYTSGLNNNYNDEDAAAGRLHVLIKPTEDLSILLSADYFQNKGAGPASAPLGQYAQGGDPYTFPISKRGSNDQKNYGFAAQVDWRLPFATLTYLGAIRDDDVDTVAGQGRGYPVGAVQPAGRCEPTTAVGCLNLIFRSREEQQSHELRLGDDRGRLKWVAGLYYFKEDNDVFFNASPAVAFIQPNTFAESKAAFAQGTYSVTDRLRVTAGLRYTQDEKGRTGGTYVNLPSNGVCPLPGGLNGSLFAPIPGCLLYANVADFTWNATNYKLGVEYDLTPTSLFYADTATGYKAGGYGDGQPPANNKYDPEHLTAYEAGIKNRFFNNRVQANISIFYYDYKDFQVSALGVVAGQPSNVTVNAPKATLYGAEFEGSAVLTDADRIDGAFSYLHARYDNFVLPTGDAFNPGRADYSGLPLAKSPEWTFSLGYQHAWTLPGDGRLTGRVQTHYESSKNLDYHNFGVTAQGAYTKTDIMLTYDSPSRRWSVMAYGRNLEDKAVLIQASPYAQTANRFGGTGSYAPPRLYGVQFSARF